MSFKIYFPWNNLGCLGLSVNGIYKGDIYKTPRLGVYVNDGTFKRWYSITGKLRKFEVISPENAARIYRRTLAPYKIVKRPTGDVEIISYPYVNEHGFVAVMLRLTPHDPTTLHESGCKYFVPQFSPKKTGIPAHDPV